MESDDTEARKAKIAKLRAQRRQLVSDHDGHVHDRDRDHCERVIAKLDDDIKRLTAETADN